MVSALQSARDAARTVSSVPQGLDYVRSVIADALYPNSRKEAAAYAVDRWGENAKATQIIQKAALPGLVTTGDGGAAMVAPAAGAAVEFFDVVRSQSIIGRLPVMRVPFWTRTVTQDEGLRVEWRDEGAAYRNTPVKMTATAGMEPFDLGALLVTSMEVLRDASLDAERWLRDQLAKALALGLDTAFVDPANSGTAGVKPASITSGAGSSNSPQEGLFDWSDEFTGDASAAYILLNPFTAARLQSANRPFVGSRGGTFGGWPVLTSTAVGLEDIILVDPGQIAVAMGDVNLRSTTQAAIELADSSSMTSAPTVTQVSLTSLFQTNSVAIAGSITANWRVLRPGAVLIFNTQSYGL